MRTGNERDLSVFKRTLFILFQLCNLYLDDKIHAYHPTRGVHNRIFHRWINSTTVPPYRVCTTIIHCSEERFKCFVGLKKFARRPHVNRKWRVLSAACSIQKFRLTTPSFAFGNDVLCFRLTKSVRKQRRINEGERSWSSVPHSFRIQIKRILVRDKIFTIALTYTYISVLIKIPKIQKL